MLRRVFRRATVAALFAAPSQRATFRTRRVTLARNRNAGGDRKRKDRNFIAAQRANILVLEDAKTKKRSPDEEETVWKRPYEREALSKLKTVMS